MTIQNDEANTNGDSWASFNDFMATRLDQLSSFKADFSV